LTQLGEPNCGGGSGPEAKSALECRGRILAPVDEVLSIIYTSPKWRGCCKLLLHDQVFLLRLFFFFLCIWSLLFLFFPLVIHTLNIHINT